MIRFSMLALAVMSFCFVSPALRAEEAAKEAVVVGVVKSVDGEKATFVLVVGENEVKVVTDKDTKYVDCDGKELKMADLVKEKAKLQVTHVNGKASKVAGVKEEAAK
jgi:hypothetical protein